MPKIYNARENLLKRRPYIRRFVDTNGESVRSKIENCLCDICHLHRRPSSAIMHKPPMTSHYLNPRAIIFTPLAINEENALGNSVLNPHENVFLSHTKSEPF